MAKALPREGLPQEEVIRALDALKNDDLPVDDGKAWGYVYHAGPEVAALQKHAVTAFMSKNGLDPTAFPSLEKLENEVLDWCIDHLHGDDKACGSFTSGGTESCMLSIKAARDYAKVEGTPEIILPTTVHAAFHKGAKYFGCKVVPIPVDSETFKADLNALREAITDQTVLIVGSAAGYAHGVIDPIEEMAAIAQEHNILMHVDGCVGAFVLNLFEELGEDIPKFDFRVPGVTSISMDLHKYGFAPKGSSVLLHRDPAVRRAQYFACASWSGYSVVNATMQSTKSGGPLAGAWAVMRYLGREGYLKLAKGMLDAQKQLLTTIETIDGLRILGKPSMGLIAIASETVDVFALADELGRKGWFVVPQLSFGNSPRNLHLQVEPGNVPKTADFLKDLRAAAKHVQDNPPAALPKPLQQMAQVLTPEMVQTNYKELMAMAGAGGGIPKERTQINQILDALTPQAKEALLIEFIGEMFS